MCPIVVTLNKKLSSSGSSFWYISEQETGITGGGGVEEVVLPILPITVAECGTHLQSHSYSSAPESLSQQGSGLWPETLDIVAIQIITAQKR